MPYTGSFPFVSNNFLGVDQARTAEGVRRFSQRAAVLLQSLMQTGQITQLAAAEFAISLTGPLKIGVGSTAITKHLSATTTWDPPNVAAGNQTTTTLAVSGAVLGNTVLASFDKDLQGMQLTGYVSAADVVTVVLRNGTGGDLNLASGTLRADVWAHT